jgi:hypothetical protein
MFSGPAASSGEVQAHRLLSSPAPNTRNRCWSKRLINVHNLSALKGEASNKGESMSLAEKVRRLKRFISENPALANIPVVVVGGRAITLSEAVSMLERGVMVSEIVAKLSRLGLDDEEELWVLAERFWQEIASARPGISIYSLGGYIPAMSPSEALAHIRARDEVGKMLVKMYASLLELVRMRAGA